MSPESDWLKGRSLLPYPQDKDMLIGVLIGGKGGANTFIPNHGIVSNNFDYSTATMLPRRVIAYISLS